MQYAKRVTFNPCREKRDQKLQEFGMYERKNDAERNFFSTVNYSNCNVINILFLNIKLNDIEQKKFECRQARRTFESMSGNLCRICVFLYVPLAKSLIFLTAVRIQRGLYPFLYEDEPFLYAVKP